MLETICGADKQAFCFINGTCHNPVLDAVMTAVAKFGDGFLLFAVALALMLSRRQNFRAAGLVVMASLTATYQLVHALKDVIARPRPFEFLPGVNAMVAVDGYSMPSTHAATAFAAAYIFTRYFGKWPLFYGIASVVAISRVYLGVHFPSDVIAGAFIGVLIGYVLSCVAGKVLSSENTATRS